MNAPTPSIVSRSAASRLPRWVLWVFVLAYVLPGFWGREPWKDHDAVAFGVMRDMAMGLTSWWEPLLLGLPVEHTGWLHHWLGAVFIALWPEQAQWMARIPFVGLLLLTLLGTWWSVYHLARLPAAQPVSFAFGGEADPHDYARTLADAGLLALLACLGLAQLAHETSADAARLAMVAVMLMTASALTRPVITSPVRTPVLWALGLLGLVLSGAPWMALVLSVGLLGAAAWARPLATQTAWGPNTTPNQRPWRWAIAMSVLVLAFAAAGGLFRWPAWSPLNSHESVMAYARLWLWFGWPAWPLALWALWRWRQQWLSGHVLQPLMVIVVMMVAGTWSAQRDRALLLALPALATLAAFALPTLRRSLSALIDWFTLLFFSGCGLILWVVWLAMQTGIPAKTANNVARLAPGFDAPFSWVLLIPAVLATGAWLAVVVWRVGRHTSVLWKSMVLPAAGATMSWLLLMTLWLPLVNHGMSHGPQSREVWAAITAPERCVLVDGLPPAQIQALRTHTSLMLRRNEGKGVPTDCAALLTSPLGHSTLHQRMDLSQWTYQATIKRLGRTRDDILIYSRNAGASR
ncbi:MAG: hypothetical protein RJB34_1025 [Pseudomonadota bacterium]